MRPAILFVAFATVFNSCFPNSDTHREEGKIFHAGPADNVIAKLYFALYKDNTYQVCSSGGLGQNCYSGNFKLSKDTLNLIDLDKQIPLRSGKLILLRYNEQDSTFWEWKYPAPSSYGWKDLKSLDCNNGQGDVYQLDENNKLLKNEIHFTIQLDSLKYYHLN